MKKYALAVVAVVIVLAVVFAGCSKGSGTIAEVNGKKISSEEFNKYMQTRAGADMLRQMIDDKITLAVAEDRGLEATNEQVELQLSILKNGVDLDELLERSGYTEDIIKEQLKVQQAKENIAYQMMKDRISDKDVQARYDMDKNRLYDLPERVKVEMAMFQNKESAEKAVKKARGGAEFTKAVEEFGGQAAPTIVPKSGPDVVPEVARLAFNTPQGKVSNPLEFKPEESEQSIWIVLKTGEKVPPMNIQFDKVKQMIEGQMAYELARMSPEFDEQMRENRKQAKVKVFEPSLKVIEKDFE
ncbi:MAG TPA: peptidyl-prolyl cis-trans isomerase [Armatimonadota bacterium]|nr:peptidyl-prolyl cis-trans isomerase [Armatimonadota bacterium]